MEGKTVGNYRILEQIGAGGMGAVYLARDLTLEREVAIKIIAPELARIPHLMARFRVEAIAQARLNHPNIVTIHAFDQQEETYYIVMEYVAGKTLKELIKEKGKIPVKQALTITSHLLAGLAYAHARGVLHRDIKPANIFVNADCSSKIGDFGIAKVKGIDGLTRVGSTLGTLLYSSPEQIRGEKMNAAADMYSLGVTLYEMVVGRLPFSSSSGSNYEIQLGHLEKIPPLPSSQNSDISPALDTVIMKSLAKLPDGRYGGTEEFKEAVDRLLDHTAGGKKAAASAREKKISAFSQFKFSKLKFPKIKPSAADSSFFMKINRKIPGIKQYLKSIPLSLRSASSDIRSPSAGLRSLDKQKLMVILIVLIIFLLFVVVVFARPLSGPRSAAPWPGGGAGGGLIGPTRLEFSLTKSFSGVQPRGAGGLLESALLMLYSLNDFSSASLNSEPSPLLRAKSQDLRANIKSPLVAEGNTNDTKKRIFFKHKQPQNHDNTILWSGGSK